MSKRSRGASAPTQPGGSMFHHPQRAWLRSGRPDQLPPQRSSPPPSDRLIDQYGTVDRKRQGAQAGNILVLRIDGRQWTIRLAGKGESVARNSSDDVPVARGSVANALRGRFPGEEVWLTTATGLPKPYGRRLQVIVLDVIQNPRSQP